jgi:hypothetical protein
VYKLRGLYGIIQGLRAHIFITLSHKGSEFEIKLANVLISSLLKMRWILLFLVSERDLRFENIDVKSLLNAKHVRTISWLKLIAVVAKKLSFAMLHQVIQLLIDPDLPLFTNFFQMWGEFCRKVIGYSQP